MPASGLSDFAWFCQFRLSELPVRQIPRSERSAREDYTALARPKGVQRAQVRISRQQGLGGSTTCPRHGRGPRNIAGSRWDADVPGTERCQNDHYSLWGIRQEEEEEEEEEDGRTGRGRGRAGVKGEVLLRRLLARFFTGFHFFDALSDPRPSPPSPSCGRMGGAARNS
jgi:hypothetical protein